MQLDDNELDMLIKKQVQSEMEQIPLPAIDQEWRALKAKLEGNRSDAWGWRPKLAVAVAAVLIFAALSLSSPHHVQALGDRIVEIYNFVVGKTTMNKTMSSSRQTSPNPPGAPVVKDLGTGVEREVTLEEAQKACDFQLALPQYLPTGTTLQKVMLMEFGANPKQVTILYDLQGKVLRFTQMRLLGDFSSGHLYDTDDTVTQDVWVNGNPAVLFVNKNRLSSLSWVQRGLNLELSGPLSADEIQKIAASIK